MKQETISLGGREITFETGEIAKQAHGAVIVKQKDTVVLVTVVADAKPIEDAGGRSDEGDFVPLTVEYREKTAAAGRFPSGFVKRESKPQDHEILASRLLDRSIRPLFPRNFRYETQVMATVFSYDPDADAEALSILGAGAALYLSHIPWNGPVGGISLVQKGGKFIAFPTAQERQQTSMDMVISCCPDGLVMVEGLAKEVPEQDVLQAFLLAQESLQPFFAMLQRWSQENPVTKLALTPTVISDELQKAVDLLREPLLKALLEATNKLERKQKVGEIVHAATEALAKQYPAEAAKIPGLLAQLEYHTFREYMVKEQKRVDGRQLHEIRPISGKVNWLPRAHGSAVFTRGETQAVVTCTLGTKEDKQMVETLAGESWQRFLLHYNFPSYSVGEVKPMRGPGRREIGHGNLALRALLAVIPEEKQFPYTIRVVSDITESNGSSSMATVCGGCLSLMDCGVPIKRPVAGIAMGLIKEKDTMLILSDIMGEEDHLGDMDFKVAGTEVGVTAVQMDNKLGSLPTEAMLKALNQAREGRMFILQQMLAILPAPRPNLSKFAPRVSAFPIRKERIRDLIGPGGKTIQELQEQHNVKIDIDPETCLVRVYSPHEEACKQAVRQIDYLTKELEVGKFYRGIVTTIKDFGAFVRVYANTEGLLHISELDNVRVESVRNILKEGDEVIVKVLGVDRQGKIRLSRKDALHVPKEQVEN